MTAPPTPPPPALPDYSGIVQRALEAKSFGQLTAATYQAVNALYANPSTPPAIVNWIAANTGSVEAVDGTLKKFLCFVVVDPELLAFNGALENATLDQLAAVLMTRVGNYVAAIARAKGAA